MSVNGKAAKSMLRLEIRIRVNAKALPVMELGNID
jgi:hypothetical protein